MQIVLIQSDYFWCMERKVFVLIGRPGAGKSVVSDQYAKMFGLPILHMGDEIRALAATGHPVASRVAGAMKKAEEYSSHDVTVLLEEIMHSNPAQFERGLILDGFPRWLGAIPAFEKFLEKNELKLSRVLFFNIPKHQSIRRQLKRKRDSKEVIRAREQNFTAEELPVVEYYQRKGLVKIVRSGDFKNKRKNKLKYFLPRVARNMRTIISAATKNRRRK